MIRKVLEACPSCGGSLEIGEVHCLDCETRVHARYRPCDFCALTEEQSTFLRLFVTSRGNLSEVEKRLGVSYPTVRAKLDEVIERLHSAEAKSAPHPAATTAPKGRAVVAPSHDSYSPEQSEPLPAGGAIERRAILEAVERGEISAIEGLSRLSARGASDEEQS